MMAMNLADGVPFYTLGAAAKAFNAGLRGATSLVVGRLAGGRKVTVICRSNYTKNFGFSVRCGGVESITVWGDAFLIFAPRAIQTEPGVQSLEPLDPAPLAELNRLISSGEMAIRWVEGGEVRTPNRAAGGLHRVS